MRILSLTFLVVFALQYAYPQDSASHANSAIELFRVMHTKENYQKVMDVMLDAMMKSAPALEQHKDLVRDFLNQYLSWDSLQPDLVTMYVATFSQQELNDMAAFYSTPSGQKAIRVLPALMQQGAALGQHRVQEHLPELQEKIKNRLNQDNQTPANSKG